MRGRTLALVVGWLALAGPARSQDLDGARVIPPVPLTPATYVGLADELVDRLGE